MKTAAHRNKARSRTRGNFRRSAISLAIAGLLGAQPGLQAAQPGQTLPAGTIPQLQGVGAGQVTVNPAAATATGQRLVIDQASQRATINWNSFNIARGSEVRFNQPNAGSSALNRIFDANPSIIQGALSANGQIYLINQNGILFDRGSQVNVQSLVASTLNITDDVFNGGLVSNASTVADFSGNSSAGILIGNYGPVGEVARINTQSGGTIMVLAAQVENHGVLSAPDGQVILAAGQRIYLTQNPDPNDVTMRGMLVEVQADAPLNLSNMVRNAGVIESSRGNVTLAGLAVNQEGRITASTAVNQNGSVWLLATNKVTTSANSVTETPILAGDTSTLAESQSFSIYRPVIRIEGNRIEHAGRIASPDGTITLTAIGDNARVYLESGSVISAAGTWSDVDPSKNFAIVKLTSNDLKDDPLQKGGFLLGKTVTVDLRKGSTLFDTSNYAAAVQRTVAEKTAAGGDITIASAGDVVLRDGATLDVSGGGYRYASGTLGPSQLVSNGKLYDVSTAPADLIYTGLLGSTQGVTHAKWGVTEYFSSILGSPVTTEAAYVQGMPGGSLTLYAPNMALDGSMKAGSTAGRLQNLANAAVSGGTLVLGDPTQIGIQTPDFKVNNVTLAGDVAPLDALFAADSPLPVTRVGSTLLSAGMFAPGKSIAGGEYVTTGFSQAQINANGRIEVAGNSRIELPAGGALSLTAADIAVNGSIVVPSGSISLRGVTTLTSADARVAIGDGVLLSAAGRWDNLALNLAAAALTSPAQLAGGSVSLSGFDVSLSSGSTVDVSGGARIAANGAVTTGAGGSISLNTVAGDGFGSLQLDGRLLGYSPSRGGTLSILAPSLWIDQSAPPGLAANTLWLTPEFVQQGGFSAYSLTGQSGVTLAAGVELHPRQQTLILDRSRAARLAGGGSILDVSTPTLLELQARPATNLTLATTSQASGSIELRTGSVIATDPGAAVKISSRQSLNVDGTIDAPAGSITLSLTTSGDSTLGNQAIILGDNARLLSRGFADTYTDALGHRVGKVLGGGSVTLDAFKNAIATQAGSIIDVSAASDYLDLSASTRLGDLRSTRVFGDAGNVTVITTEGAQLAGTLLGRSAGGAGGSFALELDTNLDPLVTGGTRQLFIMGVGDHPSSPGNGTIVASLSARALADGGFDKVRFKSADAIGFDGDVAIAAARGLTLDAPQFEVLNGGWVRLSGAQVKLSFSGDAAASALALPQNVATTSGTGILQVDAGLIDLYGSMVINGVSQVTLHSSGDLRATGKPVMTRPGEIQIADTLLGSLVTPGNLTLAAREVYPTSASNFRFAVGSVTMNGNNATFTNTPGGVLAIEHVAGAVTTPLSAGGSITFEADNITQRGTVMAPLGRIAFNAQSDVTLDAGSLTSVSAAGSLIPFGTTLNGLSWVYDNMSPLTAPPSKRIALNGSHIGVASGAVLDVSGGGDIQAVEWVPGIGGSKDVLLADNTYAILPAQNLAFAPYDSHLLGLKDLGFGKDANVYDSVYLSAGAGIPAGKYVLLPGYYALLPGAYIVRPQSGATFADLQPGQSSKLADGSIIVAGKRAVSGTDIVQARWSGFQVQPGAVARTQSEYRTSDSSFFTQLALNAGQGTPRLPADAGRVAIAATQGLDFSGSLRGQAAEGGLGAEVDLSAAQLAVVAHKGQGEGPAGAVELDAATLSALNASLLLGGTRSDVAGGTQVQVAAGSLTVAAGAELTGPEVILVATDSLVIESGATLRTAGSFSGIARDLLVDSTGPSGGALLRVSAGNQVQIDRGANADRTRGVLDIREGALVSASKSMLLDATRSFVSSGTLAVADGGFISLGAGNIRIGDGAPPAADSLLIGNAQLATFDRLDTIALRSYTGIEFYGDAVLGADNFNRITLDTAAISGVGGGAVNVRAKSVTLQNSTSGTSTAETGAGTLVVSGNQVVLAGGSQAISGFAAVTIAAAGDVTTAGAGDLRVAADLTLESARITGALNSDRTIAAVDDSQAAKSYFTVKLQRPATPLAASGTTALGAKLAITGSSIDHAGAIALPAGSVTLTAHGSGGIVLRNGSVVSATGAAWSFGDASAYAKGGTITLTTAGDLMTEAGSMVDVSGAAGGGDAGVLAIATSGATGLLTLGGAINASAQFGFSQGSALLDLAQAGNFSAINARLNQGGFSESRDIRVRSGDVTIAGENPFTQRPGDVVIANHFKLSADQGSINVGGSIDASSANGGGTIELNALNDLNLAAGSLLLARGTSAASGAGDAYSHGGSVELSARSGTLNMANGALIDVSANAAGKSSGGKVVFSARRTTDGSGADAEVAMNLAGTINVGAGVNVGQAGAVTIEGVHAYDGITDTALASNAGSAAMIDYQAFTGNAQAILTRLTGQGLALQGADAASALRVSGGVELRSSGDMTVSTAWDLTSADWASTAGPGRLSLRAAGNLTVLSSIGLPNDSLAGARTWDMRLVGGADLGAADATAVKAPVDGIDSGDVVVANRSVFTYTNPGAGLGTWTDRAARIRTGTGRLDISASRDFIIEAAPVAVTGQPTVLIDAANLAKAPAAVVYSSGVASVPDSAGRYVKGGGAITVAAGRNAVGTPNQQWIGDWYRRTTSSALSQPPTNAAGWFAQRANFKQNIGSFGGGDVSVRARGDVLNLSVMSASSGRVVTTAGVKMIDVQGGGNVHVAAAGDISGGEFLVARGTGSLSAGGAIGGTSPVSLYLMGESGDPALRRATLDLYALGDVSVRSVANPTMLTQSALSLTASSTDGFGRWRYNFFTYAPTTALSVISVAGDLLLGNQLQAKTSLAFTTSTQQRTVDTTWSDFYPPQLVAAAIQGDVGGNALTDANRIEFFPSQQGQVRLLAGGSVRNQYLDVTDVVASALPSWNAAMPSSGESPLSSSLIVLGASAQNRLVQNPDRSGYDFRVQALGGDVSDSVLIFPRRAAVEAGQDVLNVQLDVQNLDTTDVSLVRAGRDIGFTGFGTDGTALVSFTNGGYIRVGGPGRFLAQAGRNLDLGTSEGITAGGNNFNLSLPTSESAQLTVMAGVSGDVPFDTIDKLFVDLKAAGLAKDAAAGMAAVNAVFGPANMHRGDVTMFSSAIKTQGGSGIDILVPDGDINAGLPVAGQKTDIGIVTTLGGGIRSYLSGDFNINQSKVITLQGGDILAYSSAGNIDAGRGARDSLTTQPPKRVAVLGSDGKPTGLFTFLPPIDASGAGIRTLTSDPDGAGPLHAPKPGDVYLFAPSGFIDAGEAGVSSAGNIFVAALQVLNSNNFSAAGASIGVPLAPSSSISAGAAGASNVGASAAKSAEEATKALAASTASTAPTETFKPSFITVEVLGVGDEKCKKEDKDCK